MRTITISERVVNHQLHLNMPDEFNNKKVNITISESESNEENFIVQEPSVEYLLTLNVEERKKHLQKAAESAKGIYNDDRSDFQSGDFYNY